MACRLLGQDDFDFLMLVLTSYGFTLGACQGLGSSGTITEHDGGKVHVPQVETSHGLVAWIVDTSPHHVP
jgi:hypothetical protein